MILMTTGIIINILNELFGIFYTNLARHQLREEGIAEKSKIFPERLQVMASIAYFQPIFAIAVPFPTLSGD
jgi:hypothetical protein